MDVALNDGNRMPREVFGVYRVPPGKDTYELVISALKVGYRGLDTASLYRNEADVGRAVRDSGLARSDVFIISKVWDADAGWDSSHAALNKSLNLLAIEYVDLYLIHSPRPGRELRLSTWRALINLREFELTRSIGVSNYGAGHIEEIIAANLPLPAVNQIDRHPMLPRTALMEYCRAKNIIIQAHSPLARGRILSDPFLMQCAKRYNVSVAQVCLAWATSTGDCFVIGDKSGQHIKENADTKGRPMLTGDDMKTISHLRDELFVMGKDLARVI